MREKGQNNFRRWMVVELSSVIVLDREIGDKKKVRAEKKMP